MICSQGDIVEMDFGPSRGHEPMKRRPAIVVSRFDFNRMTSMTLVCPITTRLRAFPLHKVLPEDCCVEGSVVLEQLTALDLDKRNPRYLGRLEGATLQDILTCLQSFLDED